MITVSEEQQALIDETNRLRIADVKRVKAICDKCVNDCLTTSIYPIYYDAYNESMRTYALQSYGKWSGMWMGV